MADDQEDTSENAEDSKLSWFQQQSIAVTANN